MLNNNTTTANVNINILIDCQHCSNTIDLMDAKKFPEENRKRLTRFSDNLVMIVSWITHGIENTFIRKEVKCSRCSKFFTFHSFKYVQKLY